MVVAAFDDDEEVERVGGELQLVGQATGRKIDDARGGDLGLAPDRHRLDRRVGEVDQRLISASATACRRSQTSALPGGPG